MKTHSMELAIISAVDCLTEIYYDRVTSSILISNLNLVRQHEIEISNTLQEKLNNFLSNYLKNFQRIVDLEDGDFTKNLSLTTLLFEFQDGASKNKTIEIVFSGMLSSCNKLLRTHEFGKLHKYFRVMEILVKAASEVEENTSIRKVLLNLENLLIETYPVCNHSLMVYSFSLLSSYYDVVNDTELARKLWFTSVQNVLQNQSNSDRYLIITSYLINSSLPKTEIFEITNTTEFWTALKMCLENEHCVQKYALHILKSVVVSLYNDENFKSNHSFFNGAKLKEFNNWWKTYFIIMENLDEKQTHLALPVFALVEKLIDDNAVTDAFWILRLLESGLKHDSRTVRIQALLFLFEVNVSKFNKPHIPYIVKIVLSAMKDSLLFRKTFKLKKHNEFRCAFIKWMELFSCHEHFPFFFVNFYNTLIDLQWSPVPLFYTLKSLSESKIEAKCLDFSLICQSKSFICSMTRFHNIKIRASIQCLFIKFTISNCKTEGKTLMELLELLNGFKEDECLLRGTSTWHILLEYVKNSADIEFIEEYICEFINKFLQSDLTDHSAILLARNVMLFQDSFLILETSSRVKEYLLKLFNTFVDVLHKPYLNKKNQNNNLKFITCLLKMESGWKKTNQKASSVILPMVQKYSKHILIYAAENMMNCDNYELIILYESSLEQLTFCSDNYSLLKDRVVKAGKGLEQEQEYYRLGALKVILWIFKSLSLYPKLFNADELKNILTYIIKKYLTLNPTKAQISGKIYSSFIDTFWSVMKEFFRYDKSEINQRLNLVLESLDLVRKENLVTLLEAVKVLMSENETPQNPVLEIIDLSWKLVEETQTTPYYMESMKSWVRTFFQKSLLLQSFYQSKLVYYAQEMLKKISDDGGHSYYSIILVLEEMHKVPNLFDRFIGIGYLLINIFSITHINRKDQRVEEETIHYIRSLEDDISVNQIDKFKFNDSCEEMRLMALNLMLKLCISKHPIEYCEQIIKKLIQTENVGKKCYFNDSAYHRIKHKYLQLLLIFETVYHHLPPPSNIVDVSDIFEIIFDFGVNNLLTEPHQPSVRYMLEWLLVRVILHRSSLLNKFWSCFSEASEERVGSICSFISIAYHLSKIYKEQSFIEMAVESVLPWTMAQHFNARLYAQTVLVKLISMNTHVLEKYAIIKNSLESSLKTGNAVKNAIKLQQDFYFSYFHAIDHFSLRTIFWDLPRLSNICQEEWISVELYERFINHDYDFIPFFTTVNEFSNFTSSTWIVKGKGLEFFDKDQEFKMGSVQDSQKKFIPQSDFLAFDKPLEKNDDLIVVASLIDRAPNLGGLTRTCEIFGVSILVIDNLEIMKHKEFTSLSITAEKHTRINEVKKFNLFEYLKILKENGYFILGVEQTSNSKSLNRFEFPKKSALILGNEKEGIPADLLPLFDVCVEIPQVGVIRSLNVHVSASLFIWEYAKQHLFYKDS